MPNGHLRKIISSDKHVCVHIIISGRRRTNTSRVRNSKAPYYPEISTRLVIPFIGRESGFFLDQMIWDFGRTSNRVKSSKAQLRSSKYDKETTKDDVILNTVVSYYTVLARTHIMDAHQKRVVEFEKRLEQAEGFFKAGRISQTSVPEKASYERDCPQRSVLNHVHVR